MFLYLKYSYQDLKKKKKKKKKKKIYIRLIISKFS